MLVYPFAVATVWLMLLKVLSCRYQTSLRDVVVVCQLCAHIGAFNALHGFEHLQEESEELFEEWHLGLGVENILYVFWPLLAVAFMIGVNDAWVDHKHRSWGVALFNENYPAEEVADHSDHDTEPHGDPLAYRPRDWDMLAEECQMEGTAIVFGYFANELIWDLQGVASDDPPGVHTVVAIGYAVVLYIVYFGMLNYLAGHTYDYFRTSIAFTIAWTTISIVMAVPTWVRLNMNVEGWIVPELPDLLRAIILTPCLMRVSVASAPRRRATVAKCIPMPWPGCFLAAWAACTWAQCCIAVSTNCYTGGLESSNDLTAGSCTSTVTRRRIGTNNSRTNSSTSSGRDTRCTSSTSSTSSICTS